MAVTTTYGDIGTRTAAYAAVELLKRAIPTMVFEKFGQAVTLPSNSTRVISWRRYNSLPSTPTPLVEGVTPAPNTLNRTDISAQLVQYGSRIEISDVIIDTHEDPVLMEAMEILGEQAAAMIETVRFGVLRAGTNVFYANGASRSAVNTPITLDVQRRVTRGLKRQMAAKITKVVSSSVKFGTEAVAPSYIAITHPDVETDLRNMLGKDGRVVFVPTEKYGSMTPYEMELGKVEDVRYLTTTICTPWLDAGGAKGAMQSTSGTNADVYPILYIAKDSYALVALKGDFAVTPMVVNPKPSDSDPMAQRGHVAWKAYTAAAILNDQWIARAEVAVTA
jgi:N4-gp56 family major capsid protein